MKKLRNFLIVFILILVTGIILIYSVRNNILNQKIQDAKRKIKTKYGAELSINKFGFSGLTTIELDSVKLEAPNGALVFRVDKIRLSVRLTSLLRGKLTFFEIVTKGVTMPLERKNGNDNFSFLLNHNENSNKETENRNTEKKIIKLSNLIFENIPNNLLAENLNISLSTDSNTIVADIKKLSYKSDSLHTQLFVFENGLSGTLNINAKINRSDRFAELSLKPITDTAYIPFVYALSGIKSGFSELNFSFKQDNPDEAKFSLGGSCKNLFMNHPGIAKNTVVFKSGNGKLNFEVTKNKIAITDNSYIQINNLPVPIEISYERDNSKKLAIDIHTTEFQSQNLFDALPEGLFQNLKGIRTSGTLKYDLSFDVELNNPDSLHFSSELKSNQFKIEQFGKTNFQAVNGDFIHEVYEKENLMRTIAVSEANPAFVPYTSIPKQLIYSVLTSEDGGFFGHKGFYQTAFAQSISANIKTGRFKRGGSTISMQLVKNLFLNRQKNIARKLEEVLIVWLIENNRLISKERMLEIYFNIIEWGPGVYGVNDASYFYFAKPPQKLELNECIFLASIVPKPKWFKYSFEGNHLRKDLGAYYSLLCRKMIERGHLMPADTLNLKKDVELKGQAKYFLDVPLNPSDTLSD